MAIKASLRAVFSRTKPLEADIVSDIVGRPLSSLIIAFCTIAVSYTHLDVYKRQPQEYVGIKIEATEFAEEAQKIIDETAAIDKSKKIYFVAATLRPETMYGQTCCFVSPKIQYGIFDAGDSYYITTERAFKNMSYQKLTPKRGDYKAVVTIPGKAFIGTKIHAPASAYGELRILPMETVIASKGTGVVTCVPSNSPDDFMTTKDLLHKPEYYGIKAEWVKGDILPIIHTEKYGDITAETLCKDLKIQSPKDTNLLAEAKKAAYKEDYYSGVMIYGKYKGDVYKRQG